MRISDWSSDVCSSDLDLASEYVKNRNAFGKSVSEFQGIRWMLADMAMQTEAARNQVYRAAAMVDAGRRGPKFASLAAMATCLATAIRSATVRGRVCHSGSIQVVAVSLKQKIDK